MKHLHDLEAVEDGITFDSEDPNIPPFTVENQGSKLQFAIRSEEPITEGINSDHRSAEVHVSADGTGASITDYLKVDTRSRGTLIGQGGAYIDATFGNRVEQWPDMRDDSVAIGYAAKANAEKSVAIGVVQHADEPYNVVLGHQHDGGLYTPWDQAQPVQHPGDATLVFSTYNWALSVGSARVRPAVGDSVPFLTAGLSGVSYQDFVPAAGSPGPQGDKGVRGDQGPQGAQGPAGPNATVPLVYGVTVAHRQRIYAGQRNTVADSALPYGWQWANVMATAVGGDTYGVSMAVLFRQGAFALWAQSTRDAWIDGYSLVIIPWR
jgi:hypothetical protein